MKRKGEVRKNILGANVLCKVLEAEIRNFYVQDVMRKLSKIERGAA